LAYLSSSGETGEIVTPPLPALGSNATSRNPSHPGQKAMGHLGKTGETRPAGKAQGLCERAMDELFGCGFDSHQVHHLSKQFINFRHERGATA